MASDDGVTASRATEARRVESVEGVSVAKLETDWWTAEEATSMHEPYQVRVENMFRNLHDSRGCMSQVA